MITLSDALTKLRNLKSKVARVQGFVTQSTHHYEDETPDYKYAEELVTRTLLNADILKLQTQIQVTNATAKATYQGHDLTLAQLILLNAQVRSDLAFQNILLGAEGDTGGFYSRRAKDDIKKVPAAGYDKVTIRKTIEELEQKKEEIESVLNAANLRTELVEA